MADAGTPLMSATPTALTFVREKHTKNTVRYTESVAPGQAPVVGYLYVQKSWLGPGAAPDHLKVTIVRED